MKAFRCWVSPCGKWLAFMTLFQTSRIQRLKAKTIRIVDDAANLIEVFLDEDGHQCTIADDSVKLTFFSGLAWAMIWHHDD